jgi:hypothetical protein
MAEVLATAYRVRMLFGKWYVQFFKGDQLLDNAIECHNHEAAKETGKNTGLPDYERNAGGDRP